MEGAQVMGLQYGVAEVLTVLGGFVAFIGMSVRLEVRTGQNSKDIEKLDSRATILEAALALKLSAIEKSLAKIEGAMSIRDNR